MTRIIVPMLAAISFLAEFFPTNPVLADHHLTRIVIAVPGPRNLSYLPIDLIPKIGADQAEGAEVRLLQYGGGAVALQQLMARNADFAVAGVPAAVSARQAGANVAVIAAVDDAPLFVLMVRSDLRDAVRNIADLRGRAIGVNTSSLSAKTTSQQLAELALASAGVPLDDVRILPAGQSWLEQSSMIASGTADAIMGDEPFASRLLAEGKVFFLANLAKPGDAVGIPGANFLHAALETRDDLITSAPDKVAKAVRILRRSLDWIATHPPEAVVDALAIDSPEERQHLLASLRTYTNMYSRTGAFKPDQIQDTAVLFAAANNVPLAHARKLLEEMLVYKWVR